MTGPDFDLQSLELLVREAYEAAKTKGHPTWQYMTTAVLKNRMLHLTGGRFDEENYGFHTMVELAQSIPGVVEVDSSSRPPTVHLKGEDQLPSPRPDVSLPAVRIRPDLWESVLNYSVGHRWVWTGLAVEPASENTSDRDILPTVSATESREWRKSFVAELPSEMAGGFAEWPDSGASPQQLPYQLRRRWTIWLQWKVIRRLQDWFEQRGEVAPQDLFSSEFPTPGSRSSSSIRAFVEACVRAMSDQELGQLCIPASVAAQVATASPNRRVPGIARPKS